MTDAFPTDTAGLADAAHSDTIDLTDGAEFRLAISPVRKRLGDDTVRMLGYNGSIPGPTLRVPEGSEIEVDVHNDGDLEATVHWHGLRLDNRSDGTHETQQPIPVGGNFACRVQFPDAGLYWYHPHIREDYGQEMGLYGNVVVVPRDPDYWPEVHRELVLTLDDVLIEEGKIAPFSRTETTYAAMGRFGNLLLIAGEPHLDLSAKQGEVIRLYLTNTANTRVFNIAVPGAQMKLVGGDSGRVEHEQFVDSVHPGAQRASHRGRHVRPSGEVRARTPDARADIPPGRDRRRATSLLSLRPSRHSPSFGRTRSSPTSAPGSKPSSTQNPTRRSPSSPRWTWMLRASPPASSWSTSARCIPRSVSQEPGRCPQCGMKLLPAAAHSGYACPMHPEVDQRPSRPLSEVWDEARARGPRLSGRSHEHDHHHEHGDDESGTTTLTCTSTTPRHDHAHAGHEHAGWRDRVGRRHGRRQPPYDPGQHCAGS